MTPPEPRSDRRAERIEAAILAHAHGDVADAPGEGIERGVVVERRVGRASNGLAHALDEVLVGHSALRGADQLHRVGQQALLVQRVERRPEHAPGEIAGGAEEDEGAAGDD